MAFSFQAIRFDFELTFYQPAPAYAMHIMHTSNKTENPSKDALDKTEKYANCDQTDQGDQMTRQTPHRTEYERGVGVSDACFFNNAMF